jgi:DNA-binding CsgD family transcriptional regulator
MAVLEYISEGLTYVEIGQKTAYSHDGILKTSTRILRKLGARNRAHAVFIACRLGILDPKRRHGDHAGFAAHKYRGEDPCEACKQGESAYRAEPAAARWRRSAGIRWRSSTTRLVRIISTRTG